MSMFDVINRAQKPVVGERYTINSLELRTVEDKFNQGQLRNVLVMHTDKGVIYTTSAMAKAAEENMLEAEECLIGKTLIASEYYNTRLNRNLITFNII